MSLLLSCCTCELAATASAATALGPASRSQSPAGLARSLQRISRRRTRLDRRNLTLTTQPESQRGHEPAPASYESAAAAPRIDTVEKTSPEPELPPICVDTPIQKLMWHPALHDPIRVPRNPIVLCHGLYGFDVRGPKQYPAFQLHYWSSILEILRKKIGAEVIVAGVPGTEAIKERAARLHRTVAEVAAGRDISFLAHSMGGLDARHLITHIRPTEFNVRSLTTLSTPHRGSPFMAWCRANIGLGAQLDVELAQAAVDATLQKETVKPPPPLPWSLKEPLLSYRRSETEATKPVESKSSKLFPALSYSLGASVAASLLKLLDSPAYSNLTPRYLNEVFNPSTPDDPDVLYMSAAARVKEIGPWHALFLPKLILDRSEKNEIAHGVGPADGFEGNDGLVSVESAKWGKFLGIVEQCDHWQMRGAAGFTSNLPTTPKSSMDGAASAVVEKSSSPGNSWGWEDVNKLVGAAFTDKKKSQDQSTAAKVVEVESDERKSKSGLDKLAGWIVDRIPGIKSSTDSTAAGKAPNNSTSSIARAGPVSHSRSSSQQDKFDLDRPYIALCRQLYESGL